MKLRFDPSVLCIPTKNLPVNYLVNVDGHTTTVSTLIPATKFSEISGIPKATLRKWRKTGKLLPQKVAKSSYTYYGYDQIPLAKDLASERSSSEIICKTIKDAIQKIQPGEVRHLTCFKNLVPSYNISKYNTLRSVMQKLMFEGHLKRIRRGYYAIIPENKKNK